MRINLLVTKLKKTENLYNLMVQLDYLAGLCVAATLGAENWSLFVILLGVSLILGFTTVRIYTRMMRKLMTEANHDRKN